jgi:glycosyltransferase involved in cell wall biosynthesis
MKKKVSIVTSGHPYYDERIFYKFARSLYKNGYEVSIICSTVESDIDLLKDGIHIIGFDGSNLKKSEKVSKFAKHLSRIKPDVIICCEPLPILAANRIRKKNNKVKIIYDVTEWYPENAAFKLSGIKKYTTYISLFTFNIIASNLCDVIIIGEKGKKTRYDVCAPFIMKKIISYYPVLEFFKYSPPIFNNKVFTLCYAGLLKSDRGLNQLLEIAEKIAQKYKHLSVTLKLIGRFESIVEEISFKKRIKSSENFKVEIIGWCEYPLISEYFSDVDLCFDLRERNFIYNNSLPIKIFEYMACGKPFLFTDIQPIRKEIEFEKCGSLVQPNNINDIIRLVEDYIQNKNILLQKSKYARKLVEEKYNWEKESIKLLELVNSL